MAADVLAGDGSVEILVFDTDEGDGATATVIRHAGGELTSLGTVPGWGGWLRFPGDGSIQTRVRAHLLHTWFRDETFRLTANGFVVLDRSVYSMGDHPVTLQQALPLCAGPGDDTIVGTLEPGEAAVLVDTDDRRWVRIRSTERGLEGVFEVQGFEDIPAAGPGHPIFAGLSAG